MKRYALISVWDKKNVQDIALALQKAGYHIISTGNTARVLKKAGVEVQLISELIGSDEILDGRVKTLHPKIFGGILYRNNQQNEAIKYQLPDIRVVVVNFYPFESTLKKDIDVELIDIGGPAMVRAAAKNFERVAVITRIEDYDEVIDVLNNTGEIPLQLRRKLAAKAFALTAVYDSKIASAFEKEEQLPNVMAKGLIKIKDLRYGENPHQRAALYKPLDDNLKGIGNARVLGGKPLSYNNLVDAQAAIEAVSSLSKYGVVIVKHTNPCGAAVADHPVTAYEKTLAGDPKSAFGGIIALNHSLVPDVAKLITSRFYEVVIAPDFDPDALKILRKKKRLRIIQSNLDVQASNQIKSIGDYILVQESDINTKPELKLVSGDWPDQEQLKDIEFAWTMVRFAKSNAIVLAKNRMLIGVGAGQMSRVDAVELAIKKAAEQTQGAVMASDAFFPFPDSIELAAKHKVSVIVQPGGSIRDKEVIEAAKKFGITMLFTGKRAFRH